MVQGLSLRSLDTNQMRIRAGQIKMPIAFAVGSAAHPKKFGSNRPKQDGALAGKLLSD